MEAATANAWRSGSPLAVATTQHEAHGCASGSLFFYYFFYFFPIFRFAFCILRFAFFPHQKNAKCKI